MKYARLVALVSFGLTLALTGCSSDPDDGGGDATQDASVDTDTADVSEADAGDTSDTDLDTSPDADSGEEECGAQSTPQDCDYDGLTDCEEEIFGTDACHIDTDRDGLVDTDEIAGGTDPLAQDTDGDGLGDGQERELGLDPLQYSTYDDGICDCERWVVTACNQLEPEGVQYHRSPSVDVGGSDAGQQDVGNWNVALSGTFNNYTDLSIDGVRYSNDQFENRNAAAVYSDPGTEVAGFLMSHTPAASQPSAANTIEAHRQALASIATIEETTGSRSFQTRDFFDASTARYRVTLDQARTFEQFRDDLLFALAPFGQNDASGLPQPTADGPESSFWVHLTVIHREYESGEHQMLTAAALAPESSYDMREKVDFRMRDITNTTNIGESALRSAPRCEIFEPTYDPRVDLYWVVDHAASMDDDYAQVRAFAESVFERFGDTPLEFRMGITSMEESRHGRLVGGNWHTDFASFDAAFDSITQIAAETDNYGMQSARAGLRHMLGLTSNAPSESEKIRAETEVVTLFVSDDEDEYYADEDLGSTAGQALLDDLEAFFSSHGIVFSLVGNGTDCGAADGASYRALAQATGGSHASICDSDASEFFNDIIMSASGNAQGYRLDETPITSSLRVWQGEQWVPRSRENGYDYFPETNSIVFFGSYRPQRPDEGEAPTHFSVHYETLRDYRR